MSIFKI